MIRYLRLLFAATAVFCSAVSFAQTALPLNTIVTQNFNSIGSSATAVLPANWKLSSAGTGISAGWTTGTNLTSTTQAASSGLPTTGGAYNWATTAGSDRAVGFLSSATYSSPNAIMAYYRNTTGSTVTSFTLSFAVERYVVNTGSASVDFASSTDGATWISQTGGDIPGSQFPTATAAGTFSTPLTINKTVTVNITVPNNGDVYFRWVFVTNNAASQGLGLDNVSVFAGAATPVLTAKLRDLLQVDNGTPNQFNEGDVIRYRTVVKNIGTGDATGVQINLPSPPANTTMVAGSIKTSAVAVDDNYTASFNTTLSGSTVLANDIGIPTPTAVLSYGTTADAALYAPGSAGTTDAGGTITLAANGTFTYTPPTGFSGTDKFKYITGNGNLPNNDAVVTINVAQDITFFSILLVDPSCNGGSNGSLTVNAGGGNGTLQYSITGASGTYQASNVFNGLSAGTYNVAVKDAGGYVKTASPATLTNPATIVVNGTIPQLTYNTVMATASFNKTNGSGSPATPWSASGLPAGVTINAATGDVTGTPTATGTFNATITYTDAGGCTGSKAVTVIVAPNIAPETYTAVGNTQLAGGTSPATPKVSVASLAANDASNAAITYALVTGPSQGAVTINTDGTFTYTPAAGNTSSTSFTYSGTSNGVTKQATATVNFNGKVWYVQAGGAAGDGRSNTPLNVLPSGVLGATGDFIYVEKEVSGTTGGSITLQASQQLIGAGATLNIPTASPVLTIAGNSANTPTLTGTVTLANSITAAGFNMNTGASTALTNGGATVSGVNVNIGTVTTTTGSGIALTGTGNSVTMTLTSLTTSGAANAINLTNTAGTVTINGGSLTGGAGAAVNISGGTVGMTYSGSVSQATASQPLVSVSGGHSTGTITFQTGLLSATNGTGLQFDNADGTYNFNGTTTLNGGDAGIDILNASAGTFNFGSDVAITNPTNEVIKINASTANVTYSGSFTKNNNGVSGIFINGETGGIIAINGTGTKTLSTSTANAVNLTSNAGATINFSGNNLSLTTSGGTGFNATGGGTVTVAGGGNTIVSGTGTALNVISTNIGAGGLTFQSISANGGANGIVLNSTGTSGGLTVTGDGTNTTKGGNSSGGIIQNMIGADGSTAGIGIYLNSTSNVVLKRMTIKGTIQNIGIHGLSVTGFTLQYSTIASTIGGTIGTSSGSNDLNLEGPIIFGRTAPSTANGLLGTCLIDNCIIRDGIQHNAEFYNQSGAHSLTISNSDIVSNGAALGSDGINVEMTGTANSTISVQGCTLDDNASQAMQLSALGSSVVDVTVNNSTIKKTTKGNEGVVLQNGGSAHLTIHFTSNTVTGFLGNLLLVGTVAGQGTSSANLVAVVRNNTFTQGSPNSNRAVVFFPSSVQAPGNVPTSNVLFDNNNITSPGDSQPLFLSTPDAGTSPSFSATVTNNHVTSTSTAPAIGIDISATQGTTSNGVSACVRVSGNVVTFPNAPGSIGIRVRQANPGGGAVIPTVNLEQGSSAGTATTVLAANNPGSATTISGTVTVVANNTCSAPPN